MPGSGEEQPARIGEYIDKGSDVGVPRDQGRDGVTIPERILRFLHYAFGVRGTRSA
jgi:hypothetical protein